MIIRKATKNDLDGIYALFLELAKAEDASAHKVAPFLKKMRKRRDDFEQSAKKDLLKSIRKRNSYYIVVEENNKLLGYAFSSIFDPKDNFFDVSKIGYVNAIVVTKKARGKGVAKKLYGVIENWFKQNKCKHIYLEVFSTNIATKIYEKWGFKDTTHKMWKKL